MFWQFSKSYWYGRASLHRILPDTFISRSCDVATPHASPVTVTFSKTLIWVRETWDAIIILSLVDVIDTLASSCRIGICVHGRIASRQRHVTGHRNQRGSLPRSVRSFGPKTTRTARSAPSALKSIALGNGRRETLSFFPSSRKRKGVRISSHHVKNVRISEAPRFSNSLARSRILI